MSSRIWNKGFQTWYAYVQSRSKIRPCEDEHRVMALEEADVGFEAVVLPHLSDEEVMVVLGLPVRCVLGEERFSYVLEVVERI